MADKPKAAPAGARRTPGGGGKELARLRRILLAIPGATERLSHGEPTWFTGEKGRVFAMFDNHHHGAPHISVYFATPPEVQQALVAAEPGRYWVPPYVGCRGWVAAILDDDPDWDALQKLADAAFRRAATPPSRR
jgi:hypothetical protein